jgi:hypothetical protein
MMLAVFVAMSCALVLAYFGQRRLSLVVLLVCFVLAVKLFLWEIYSPEYGFRMPWIQTDLAPEHNRLEVRGV